jgi:hypothetical protein
MISGLGIARRKREAKARPGARKVAAMSDTSLVLGLFAVPTAALLWAAARTQFRITRGQESGQLKRPNSNEVAAGAAALAASFGFLF